VDGRNMPPLKMTKIIKYNFYERLSLHKNEKIPIVINKSNIHMKNVTEKEINQATLWVIPIHRY
jgi:hypothetical protein